MADTRHDETVAPTPHPTDPGTVNLAMPGPTGERTSIVEPSPAGPGATIDAPPPDAGATIDVPPPDTGPAATIEVPAPARPTLTPPRPGTMAPDAARPGDPSAHRIAGYEVLKELGRGAMGVVYKARHLALGRVVALKMILSGVQAGTVERVRFQIEAEAVARLSHPNIVQLYEIGEYDGQPFFSLEFCDGGTLSGRLDGGGLPPREAAGIVEQLARGMDSAHRAGVIHRDLKPANVLLTSDGTPKVTDFGLARHLDTGEDSRATRAGSIMGTPSYMPPEQAAGESVGPAADIYALGAILYDVLTGRPPFQGKTIFETLTQVKNEEPVPPSRLTPGELPRDLETICLKCLQKEPGKRYPSAGHLADDLRAYLDGRPISARPTPLYERAWMWSRRNPSGAALAAVGIAAVLALVIGAPLYARSESLRAAREAGLRDRAEQNLRAAQEAVETMMTRVAEERLEFEPRLEGMRRDLLQRAVRFYDRFLEQAGDDPVMREQAARALARVGTLRRQLGEADRAEEAYRQALLLLDRPETVRERAAVRIDLAGLRGDAGLYRDAIADLVLLHGNSPEDPGLTLDLATARAGLAVTLANAGDRAAAVGQLADAAALLRPLVGVAARRELARVLGSLAQLRREAGQVDKVRPLLDEALRTWLGLSDLTPDDRHELALIHDRIGDLSRATRPADAIRWHREAAQLAAALVADYPTFPHHKSLLAQARNNLGLALLAAGMPGADAELRDSLAMKQLLADGFPRNVGYRRDVASALVNHAILMQSRGNAAEAEAAYARAADLYAGLGDRPGAAKARTNQGVALQSLNRLADAENAYRAALKGRGEVAADAPVEHRFEAARTRFLLATALQMTGQLEEAERLHRSALETYRALSPEPDHVLALCGGLNNLADLLRATARGPEAVRLWEEVRAKLAALAKATPLPLYAQEEARALHNIGATYTQTGKLKEGLQAHEAALKIRLKLAADHPREPAYRQEVASSYGELGVTHGTANRLDRSAEAFRRAIEIVTALGKEYPKQPAILGDELVYQTNLAGVSKATGDDAGWKKCNARIVVLKAKLGMK